MLIAGWCGLRAGEVRGLRRRDLDLAEGVIHVRQAVTRTKGEIHVGPPKTAAGIRDVGIPPHLLPHVATYVASRDARYRSGPSPPAGSLKRPQDSANPTSPSTAIRTPMVYLAGGHRRALR